MKFVVWMVVLSPLMLMLFVANQLNPAATFASKVKSTSSPLQNVTVSSFNSESGGRTMTAIVRAAPTHPDGSAVGMML